METFETTGNRPNHFPPNVFAAKCGRSLNGIEHRRTSSSVAKRAQTASAASRDRSRRSVRTGGMQTFPSVEAFYDDDERRLLSPELDFGVWWRRHGVVYRLTWVDRTGELIAVQMSSPTVRPFAVPPGSNGATMGGLGVAVIGGDAGGVTVLGVVHDRDAVERLLEGWADYCGAEDSLVWVLRQIVDAGLEAPE